MATLKNLSKVVTYPTLGNLPVPCREKIEEIAGQDTFNSEMAGTASTLLNFVGYAALGGLIAHSMIPETHQNPPTILLTGIGVGFGTLAGMISVILREMEIGIGGSIIGGIASIPLYIGAGFYEAGKAIKNRPDKWERIANQLAKQ